MKTTIEQKIAIAEQIIEENEGMFLTGSLMLYLRGIDLGREIGDLDFVCPYECLDDVDLNDSFIDIDICDDYDTYAITAQHEDSGVHIDILFDIDSNDWDDCDVLDGIPCADIITLISAKINHYKQGSSIKKMMKHRRDLIAIKPYAVYGQIDFINILENDEKIQSNK